MGFTPAYSELRADWDPKIPYPYMVDQELYQKPVLSSYLYTFMALLAAASGEKAHVGYETLLGTREKPLFETLKDLPVAQLSVSAVHLERSGADANLWLQLVNGDNYARLVRVRLDDSQEQGSPYLVLYDDNYFDLLPHEARTVNAKVRFRGGRAGTFAAKIIVSGTNVEPVTVPVPPISSPEVGRTTLSELQ